MVASRSARWVSSRRSACDRRTEVRAGTATDRLSSKPDVLECPSCAVNSNSNAYQPVGLFLQEREGNIQRLCGTRCLCECARPDGRPTSDRSDIYVRDQQVPHRDDAYEVAGLPDEDMSDPAGHHLFGNFCHCCFRIGPEQVGFSEFDSGTRGIASDRHRPDDVTFSDYAHESFITNADGADPIFVHTGCYVLQRCRAGNLHDLGAYQACYGELIWFEVRHPTF